MTFNNTRRELLLGSSKAVVMASVTTYGGAALSQASNTATTASSARPVRILVGFPPGGGTDVIARMLAERLRDELGQQIVVENRPGAGGQLAAQALKASSPDGTTLFISHDHTITILPLVMKNPGFNPAQDFVPVAGFASFVNAFAVSAAAPVSNFAAYLKWVQEQSDKKERGSVGIPAPASTLEFLVGVMQTRYKLDIVAAPYRGSAPMIADMLGQQIPAGMGSVPDFIEHHKGGKLRVLAVLGGKRQAALPEVPTFAELGLKGLEDMPFYGFFAVAGTPRASIERFSGALAKVLGQPQVASQLSQMGLTVEHMTAEQLGKRERAYAQVWADIVRESGFKPQ
jgi:tripartite-type tricarboxylate transporter receptor subunit TctC|nr:Twin-arginine translocation pathway signal [Oxalobacteraceae bacterium]